MTTDRKNFDFRPGRGIIMTIKYPGVAYRLGTWFGKESQGIDLLLWKTPQSIAAQRVQKMFSKKQAKKYPLLTTY